MSYAWTSIEQTIVPRDNGPQKGQMP